MKRTLNRLAWWWCRHFGRVVCGTDHGPDGWSVVFARTFRGRTYITGVLRGTEEPRA